MRPAAPHSPLGRSSVAAAALCILSLVAAACGTITPDSLAFADTEQTTLRVVTPRIEGLESAITVWEREHPTVDIEVVLDSAEDHHEWLRNGANGSVDILAFEGNYGAEARELPELFVDLRQHGLADLETDFLSTLWAEGIASGGELIGLPVDVDAHVLIVRQDLLQPDTTTDLFNAASWCDVIQAGNDFVGQSGVGFFADGEELLRAITAQGRASLLTTDGTFDTGPDSELLRAWNLAMLAIGEDPVGTSPCPDISEPIPIAGDLNPGDPSWSAEIASDGFAAVITKWSNRERISQAYPESTGNWLAIPLPTDESVGSGASSQSGLHFGISAESEHFDIALDFLLTITNPVIQRRTFADGLGPLPAINSAYSDGSVLGTNDGFLVGRPTIGQPWTATVRERPAAVAAADRPIAVATLIDALGRVQGGLDTPEEAWNNALTTVATELSER